MAKSIDHIEITSSSQTVIESKLEPLMSIHGGQVAYALACNAGCYGFAPQLQRLFLDLFSRVDTVSGTEGLKMVCVTLQELTVTSNVSGDNW